MSRRMTLGIIATLAALFALLAGGVAARHAALLAADARLEHLLAAARSTQLLKIFGWVTLLGDATVIIGIAALAGISILAYKLDKAYLAGLAAALAGAAASDYVIKILIARPRPGGLMEDSYSFPSGHATAALALYGFIAYMLCRLYPRQTGKIIAIATIIILLVGFSRLYLGVHFASDVAAGYLLGGFWLALGGALAERAKAVRNHP